MPTISVTGASGFLGRHILKVLAGPAVDVVAHARTARSEQIDGERLRWVTFDLADAPADAFDRLGRPDIVLHLAWQGLPHYLSPHHFAEELPRQYAFLDRLAAAGLARLVVTGTCLEYGLASGERHEHDATEPTTYYGLAKDALRRAMAIRAASAGIDLRWLRLFYQYGAGQAPTSLYSLFLAAVAHGDAVFDMSRGEQIRDFMAVEDVAAAIVAVALAPEAPGVVNICSGVPRSVRGLVEDWRAAAGADIALNLGRYPYPSYEPFAFWGDRSRLKAILGD